MKICYLTQTAADISDYYKAFFKDKDLFFITFKKSNPKALDCLKKSTWADGRNRLWTEVKDKYDYYVFIDDDLVFCNIKYNVPIFSYLYSKIYKRSFSKSFFESESIHFFSRLEYYLLKYKPEIAAVSQLDGNPVNTLDMKMLKKSSFVRRTGFFDAQFTVMSNYAANKLLPYDTTISGWASAQVLLYFYCFHVFKEKAISIIELAVKNSFHTGAYVENYEGVEDCRRMIEAICQSTGKNFNSLAGFKGVGVDYLYGREEILEHIPDANARENYRDNFVTNVIGLERVFNSNFGYSD